MEPGRLTPETYHTDTARISKSGLDLINKAPAHYWQRYLSPYRPEHDTQAFLIGRAFHVAVSEPDKFFDRYIVSPAKIDRRTREGKEKWAEFELAAEGKTILQSEPDPRSRHLGYDQVMRMRDSARRHPAVSYLLSSGIAEEISLWEDGLTGAACKSMRDWRSGNIIVDFKSTDDASPEGFARSVRKYRYDVQNAFYIDGYFEATGRRAEAFIFVAVEKKPPYICEAYYLPPEDVDRAREKYQANLIAYVECRKRGKWGGYTDGKINLLTI